MKRFWDKVDTTRDCWVWTAAKDDAGYGQFRYEGKNIKAHRVSFFMAKGYWPTITRHSCDNPSCVRPDHLLDGSHKDNSDDKFSRNRGQSRLKNQQVLDMRSRKMTNTIVEELATEFKVTRSMVVNALTGVTFGHLPGAVALPRQKSLNSKLTIEQVKEIKRELNHAWWGQVNHLANKYGVAHSEISHIKNGRAHKDVSIYE